MAIFVNEVKYCHRYILLSYFSKYFGKGNAF